MTVHRVYADFQNAEQAERVRKWFGGFIGIDDLAKIEKREPCTWTEDEDGNWNTDCGKMWCLESRPSDNRMRFCHGCGRQLVEKPYQEPTDPG